MTFRIMNGPFAGLRRNHYRAIVADPPWTCAMRSEKGEGRSASQHYETMSLDAIKALPVQDIAHKDAVLFLWVTDPNLLEAREVIEAWGFTYRTVGFYWHKTNKDGQPFMGSGYWTRANCEQVHVATPSEDEPLLAAEQCHLAARGKGRRRPDARGVRKLILAPEVIVSGRRQHSRKPDEHFARVEALVEGPYVELFSRDFRKGWDVWGREAGKFAWTASEASNDPFTGLEDVL